MKFREVLQKIKKAFTHQGELESRFGKQIYEQHDPLRPNIYEDKIYSEYAKKFHTLHVNLKYRFVVPIVAIYKYLFGKYLDKDIPAKPWNTNIKIFDESFDHAQFIWKKYFLNPIYKQELTDEQIKETLKNNTSIHMYLNTCKQTVNAVYLDDTAYREFVNILMFELYKRMKKEYENEAHHLLYDGKSGTFAYDLYTQMYGQVKKINIKER